MVEAFFFFCRRMNMKEEQSAQRNQAKSYTRRPNSPSQPSIPGILFHVGSGRGFTIRTACPWQLEQRLAAAHDSNEPHLSLHACSVRCRMRWVSPRAFALASCDKKLLVSVDHRPPTSTAITTSRARRWTPTSSGYMRAFLLRAASRATPSTSAASLLAVPSPGVHSLLCPLQVGPQQGKAIRHNLKASSVRAL